MTREEAIELARRFVAGRKHDYRLTFLSPPGQEVLRDLARFCRANTSTFDDNERVQSKLDGRREVWLRIQEHLNLQPEALYKLYGGPQGD